MIKNISYPFVLLLALTLVGATLSLHFADKADSMLNDKNQIISEQTLTYVVELHQTDPTFNRRPLTTWLIQTCATTFHFSIGTAFILVNFFLYFLSAVALYHLSKLLQATNKMAAINMVVYLLCFSNLFAFFPPIYAYDEPLQYLLLFLTFIAYLKKKYVLTILLFTGATIARESSLFLLPAFVLFFEKSILHFPIQHDLKNKIKKITLILIPVIFYLCFNYWWIQKHQLTEAIMSDLGVRLTGIELNFESSQAASETIISFYLVLGVPLLFIFWNSIRQHLTDENKKWINAFLLTLILNSIIVLTITKAREARLFAIPLLFIWPVFTQLFKENIQTIFDVKNYVLLLKKWQLLLYFFGFNVLSYFIAQYLYVNTAGGDDWFTEYMMCINFIFIATVFFNAMAIKMNKKSFLK